MKKRVVIEIVCAILIFVVGYFIGDASAIKRVNGEISQSVQTKSKERKDIIKNEENKQEQGTKVSNTTDKSNSIAVVNLNDKGNIKDFEFNVLKVECTNQLELLDSKTTENNFVIVKLGYMNKKNIPRQLNADKIKFYLKDNSTGNVSYPNSDIQIGLNSYNKNVLKEDNIAYIYDNVNPDFENELYVVFDVPYQLENASFYIASEDDASTVTEFKLNK